VIEQDVTLTVKRIYTCEILRSAWMHKLKCYIYLTKQTFLNFWGTESCNIIL